MAPAACCLARPQAIRDHSKILMGKNTMMRRCIRLYCERTGNDQWLQLLDHMVRRWGRELLCGGCEGWVCACARAGHAANSRSSGSGRAAPKH